MYMCVRVFMHVYVICVCMYVSCVCLYIYVHTYIRICVLYACVCCMYDAFLSCSLFSDHKLLQDGLV